MTQSIDTARLTLMLNDLRLPAIKQDWPALAERADKESWPAARFLATLAEHEIAERDRRRIARHLAEAQLLPGKTLDSFDFDAVPMVSKAHVLAICAGDSWIDKGANLLLIGGPGGGKTHLASAIGLALVENGWRVLFARTSDLVQRLQVARRELALEAAINRLDRFHLLILDDLAYVSKDQAETSVLFELISARYERRSTLITANQPFGAWGKVFPDPAMTLAAVDRLVHHATIFEINVDSYRRRAALERKQKGAGRPQKLRDNQGPRTVVARPTIKPKLSACQRQSDRTSSSPLRSQILILIDALSHPDCRAIRPVIKPSGMDKGTESPKSVKREQRRGRGKVRWPALSEQCFAFDKWNRCRFPLRCAFVGVSRREGVARPE